MFIYIYTVFEAQCSITRIIMRMSTNYGNMVRRTRVVSLSTCESMSYNSAPPPPLPHPSPPKVTRIFGAIFQYKEKRGKMITVYEIRLQYNRRKSFRIKTCPHFSDR